ncbi:hypothetical protein [Vulcanisaeta thermophila]|uniref:hypothetical protein n=1 Tax=Vulcanisaeta thermophila TaxID=867917 RepID=UPI000A005EDA|nr:hypothetical protein [Vulcanisaeta thermophila]
MRCQVCDELEAHHKCRVCGRVVCDLDFNKELNVCRVCEATLCQVCRSRLAVGHCVNCARTVCRVDSVRFGLGRLCIECAAAFGVLRR